MVRAAPTISAEPANWLADRERGRDENNLHSMARFVTMMLPNPR
jgi:hypothetical protein